MKNKNFFSILSNVKTDREYAATTGLTKAEFEALWAYYDTFEKENTDWQTPKKGGVPVLKNSKERLFFLLYYLKVYPSYDVLGISFGMDGSTAHRNITDIYPLVQALMKHLGIAPLRDLSDMDKATLSNLEKKHITLCNSTSYGTL